MFTYKRKKKKNGLQLFQTKRGEMLRQKNLETIVFKNNNNKKNRTNNQKEIITLMKIIIFIGISH